MKLKLNWWLLKKPGYLIEYERDPSDMYPPKMPSAVKTLKDGRYFLGEHEKANLWSKLDGNFVVSNSVIDICHFDTLFHVIDVEFQTERGDLEPESLFDVLLSRNIYTLKYHVGNVATLFGQLADLKVNEWGHFVNKKNELALSVRKQTSKADWLYSDAKVITEDEIYQQFNKEYDTDYYENDYDDWDRDLLLMDLD